MNRSDKFSLTPGGVESTYSYSNYVSSQEIADSGMRAQPSLANASKSEETDQVISDLVQYHFTERKYDAGVSKVPLETHYYIDFFENGETTEITSLKDRVRPLSWGALIKGLSVRTSQGNSYPVLGVIDLEKYRDIYFSDDKFARTLSHSFLKYDVVPIEKDENGKITKIYYSQYVKQNWDMHLSAIAEIRLGALEGIRSDAKNTEFHSGNLDNFSLWNTHAKMAFIPIEEFREAHRQACEEFNVKMPVVKEKSSKKKSGCAIS